MQLTSVETICCGMCSFRCARTSTSLQGYRPFTVHTICIINCPGFFGVFGGVLLVPEGRFDPFRLLTSFEVRGSVAFFLVMS